MYSEMGEMGVCETSVKNVTIMRFDLPPAFPDLGLFLQKKENAKIA